ncbi:MAG: outer membrane beta-barrel protein [Terriglobales bacterium]
MAGVMVTSPRHAPAQATDSAPAPTVPVAVTGQEGPWWKQISSNGYVSLSYTYNFNDPSPRIDQFRIFDFNDNDPQLDVAELVVQRAISEPNQFGFRFDLIAGSGVPEVTAAYGLFRDMRTGIAHHVDIPQLFISYIAPVAKGLRFDLGKFASFMGYEVIGGYDGYNDNFSRSFSFGYGVPFTLTGLRASYAFSRKITATVSVTNGWDDVQRLNHAYTVGTQVALTPTKTTSISVNFIHGPERRQDTHDQRSVYELVATWKPVLKLTLGGDGLYGHEENGVAIGHDALWKGLAGYAKYSLTSKFSLAFRGGVFYDGGGTRTGTDQTLNGFTLTPEYDLNAEFSRLNSHFRKADGKFVVRGELREDHSNKDVFLEGSIPSKQQQLTSAVNLIYLF